MMTREEYNDIISTAIMVGENIAIASLIPESRYIRKKDVIMWIRMKGYTERTLNTWIDSGWLNPRKKGERSATLFLRSEVATAILKENSKRLFST